MSLRFRFCQGSFPLAVFGALQEVGDGVRHDAFKTEPEAGRPQVGRAYARLLLDAIAADRTNNSRAIERPGGLTCSSSPLSNAGR